MYVIVLAMWLVGQPENMNMAESVTRFTSLEACHVALDQEILVIEEKVRGTAVQFELICEHRKQLKAV